MPKRINPRRRPATQADVQRANDEAAKRRWERESKCRIYWCRLAHALEEYGEQVADNGNC